MRCNCWGGGEGAEFYRHLVQDLGQREADNLFKDKQKTVKADHLWYLSRIVEYEEKLAELKKSS